MRTLSLVAVLAAACTASLAPSPTHAADNPRPALATVVAQRMQEARIPGAAVAYVRQGRIVSVQVFGERAPGVPMTADAQFNVASLTKPVFATLVARMIADGKLTLDTRLSEYWTDPDIASDDRRLALTPRLTLSHQSGFPNWRNEKLAFDFTPGARHEYSGEGFEYTRKAIEKMSGKPMSELMRTYVLEPAGMRHTYFGWNDAIAGHEVTGFNAAGKPLPTDDLKQREPNAAAHLFATVGDYARFSQWVATGAGLPRSLRREIARSQAQHPNPVEYFGIGWRLIQLGKETVLAHDGRERGVRTQVFVLPDSGEALVVLTNSDHGELLVQPAVEATLTRSDALLRQLSRDVWLYMQSIPAEQIQPMMQGITRSPSFMSKLLHAVDATLVAGSGLDKTRRMESYRAIDRFVIGMVQGHIDQKQALTMFEHLLDKSSGQPRLHAHFTTAQAAAWHQALTSATRPTEK